MGNGRRARSAGLGSVFERGGDDERVRPHPPVDSSRSDVLPDPPFRLEPLDPQISVAHYMSGSPDRLVVLSDYGDQWYVPPAKTMPPAKRKLAAFDFRRWRWKTLPKPRYDPVALPDGLAAVGLKCGPQEDSNAKCRVEVSTLRWNDTHWRNHVVTKHAEWVHEGGFVEPIGVRGRYAVLHCAARVAREPSSASARDGDVRKLPLIPRRGSRSECPRPCSRR